MGFSLEFLTLSFGTLLRIFGLGSCDLAKGLGFWLRVWGLGFRDLAKGLGLKVLGFDFVFGV